MYHRAVRRLLWPAGFAVAYFLLGRLGYLLVDHPGGSAVFWPPNGLYLAALLLAPRRRWPAYLAAALVASTTSSLIYGRPLGVALGYFAGNTAEVLSGAWLAPLVAGGRPRTGSVRGLAALVLVPAAAGLVVSSAVRVAAILLTGGAFGPAYWVWWGGSALGVVIVAPFMLAWTDPRERIELRTLRRRLEAAALVASHGLVAALFVTSRPGAVYATELLLLPPMLWAAIRFGPRAATLSVLGVAVTVVITAAAGRGLMARAAPEPGGEVLSIQFFLGLLLTTVLLAAAASAERKRSGLRQARAERRLRGALRAARLWRFASSQATDPLVMLRQDGEVIYANEAFARVVGHPVGEVTGRPAWSFIPGATEDSWRAWFGQVRAAGRVLREEWVPGPRGQTIPFEVAATHVATGGEAYLVQTMRDLSDRRQAEAAARLAGVGTLAAGMAHEINNPLSFVAANLELAGEAVTALEARPEEARAIAREARQALADAHAGTLRVRDIVRGLKVFTREEEGTGAADVRRALQAALAIARNELRHRARLTLRLDEPVPLVVANEHRLGQVFLNLLVNAAQAIPAGQADAHEVVVTARAADGEVVAEVRDSGAGMSPQVRARIFEPFFTTKPVGQGTGLGLSICHGIVAAVGGRIEVETAEGRGSTFRVVLPAAPPPPNSTSRGVERTMSGTPGPAPEGPAPGERPPASTTTMTSTPNAPAPPDPRPRAKVLVVDDEPMVGTAVRRLLSGHDVTVVQRAADAQALLDQDAAYDLILCDLMMPEMTGMALHAWLEARSPALAARMTFVTGGAFTDEAREFLERHGDRRLEKPFDVAALRAAVAASLRPAGHPGR